MARTNTAPSVNPTISTEDMMDALGFNDIDNALAKINTTSGKIRYLTSQGMARKDIAAKLGVRYQHVRNVQLQVLKRDGAK